MACCQEAGCADDDAAMLAAVPIIAMLHSSCADAVAGNGGHCRAEGSLFQMAASGGVDAEGIAAVVEACAACHICADDAKGLFETAAMRGSRRALALAGTGNMPILAVNVLAEKRLLHSM